MSNHIMPDQFVPDQFVPDQHAPTNTSSKPTCPPKSLQHLGLRWTSMVVAFALSAGMIGCTSANTAIPTEFTLNASTDSVDINPGDRLCADAQTRCSLRAAIMESNALEGAQSIIIPAGNYLLTLAGANENAGRTGDLDLSSEIKLIGADAGTTIIDANGLDRAFHAIGALNPSVIVTAKNLSVKGGIAVGNGGGWLNEFANLTLENVVFSGNSSSENGGGLNTIGGTSTLSNLRFANNIANGHGGGLSSETENAVLKASNFTNNLAKGTSSAGVAFGGGGLFVSQSLEVSGTVLTGNKAPNGSGGGILNVGRINLITSSLNENQAGVCGGGLASKLNSGAEILTVNASSLNSNRAGQGAGFCISSGKATLTNTTISENQASDAGGGLFVEFATTGLIHTTMTGNTTGASGGSDVFAKELGTVAVRSSILASTAASTCQDSTSGGGITSSGGNVVGDSSCVFAATADLQNANPQLSGLSTVSNQVFFVRIPSVGSPALNRVPANLCSSVDARGVTRPQGSACDSGAVERTPSDP